MVYTLEIYRVRVQEFLDQLQFKTLWTKAACFLEFVLILYYCQIKKQLNRKRSDIAHPYKLCASQCMKTHLIVLWLKHLHISAFACLCKPA